MISHLISHIQTHISHPITSLPGGLENKLNAVLEKVDKKPISMLAPSEAERTKDELTRDEGRGNGDEVKGHPGYRGK